MLFSYRYSSLNTKRDGDICVNKTRRAQIDNVIKKLSSIESEVSMLRDEEQDYMDNMPDNFQDTDRYYAAEDAVYNLDDASDSILMAIDSLQESKG